MQFARYRIMQARHFFCAASQVRYVFLLLALLIGCTQTHAQTESPVKINGLLDVRALQADATRSWLEGGLGKQRFDDDHSGLQLGQAVLEIKSDITDTLNGKLVFNGYTDRDNFADVSEAYVQWKPLPVSEFRFKARVGAFFPTLSLENSGSGWTNPWMISTSAINTWVGEELRTLGTEISLSRPGQMNNSAQDFEIIASVFRANDPAGALLIWRGWSLGDRVTGLTERIPLPAIPAYEEGGQLAWQTNWEEPFHEIDGRYGYYSGFNYGYNGWLAIRALHYDNRGNPNVLQNGQFAWTTRFDHASLKLDLPQDITLMGQYMSGFTQMGGVQRGALADFDASYILISKNVGRQRLTLRADKFSLTDKDVTPGDDNNETGHAIAIAWLFGVDDQQQWGVEYLKISSVHPGREYLKDNFNEAGASSIAETNVQIFYRLKF